MYIDTSCTESSGNVAPYSAVRIHKEFLRAYALMGSEFKHLWATTVLAIFSFNAWRCYAQQCNAGDEKALLEFKAGFTDPGGLFTAWQSGSNCCTWQGVNCTSSGRVQGLEVFAPFPSRGPDPRRDPSYTGVVGATLGDLSELRTLTLQAVFFDGPMPNTFDKLKKLEDLYLFLNNFTGSVSPSLGGATSLKNLRVDIYGPFPVTGIIPAPIPSSFCSLINLRTLNLRFQTSGSIPSCFCKFTQLTLLNLNGNNLVGEIPNCIGYTLHELADLDLGSNQLPGPIPPMLGRLTNLQFLDLSVNQFSGSIPEQVGNLVNLIRLNLNNNSLSGAIPDALGRLTKLEVLDLSFNFLTRITPQLGKLVKLNNFFLNSNKLQGSLPPEMRNAGSQAEFGFTFDVSNNILSGTVPDVCTKGSLRSFVARNNFFSGGFPLALASCLQVDLSNNFLWDVRQMGSVPAKSSLQQLILRNNRFSGPVPSWLIALFAASSESLEGLDISSNKFTGAVPPVLFTLSNIQALNLSRNSFSSELPTTVVSGLKLDMGHNQIFGQITSSLFASLKDARYLDLSFNKLSGPLPANSGDFPSLFYMDLSNNQLTGTVPDSVEQMPNLLYLDLSNNNFTGRVPSKRPPPGETLPDA